jgi:hypothetical protein
MTTCINEDGNPIENNDTGECASCGSARRKAERRKVPVKKPIKKVSDKKKNDLDQYAVLRNAFLLRKWCAVHGKPCIPTDVHHRRGKVGTTEQGIPRLLDITEWIPVCREAHDWITEHSKEAIDQGYSKPRNHE